MDAYDIEHIADTDSLIVAINTIIPEFREDEQFVSLGNYEYDGIELIFSTANRHNENLVEYICRLEPSGNITFSWTTPSLDLEGSSIMYYVGTLKNGVVTYSVDSLNRDFG